MQLGNSVQALDRYNEDSDDDLALVGEGRYSHRSTMNGDGAMFDGSDEVNYRPRNARRRLRRGRVSSHVVDKDGDSDSETDDGDATTSTDELGLSYPRTRRRLRRGIGRSARASSSDGYDYSSRGKRASRRQRKVVRNNLRERFEDDLPEVEIDVPKRQKYSGAREKFQELSRDDEFRQRHFPCCATCHYYEDDEENKGLLVFCQGCTSSYHEQCLGPRATREHLVTKIDEDSFVLQCRRCLGMSHSKHDVAPHTGRCAVCNEEGPMSRPLRERLSSKEEQQQRVAKNGADPVTSVDMASINNIDNVLFRCASCQRAFHVEHLAPFHGRDKSDVFDQYSQHWQCQDCLDAPGEIEELVAWRPFKCDLPASSTVHAEAIPEVDKEYLIKWKRKSYFRVTWMPGDWVWGRSNHAMRRAFYKASRSQRPILTTEDAVNEDKLRVDIVFDVRYIPGALEADGAKPENVKEAFVKYKGLNYEDSVWETPRQPSEVARWADFKDAFNDFLLRDTIHIPNRSTLKAHLTSMREKDFEKELLLKTQPEMVTGGDLMEYQLDGVNWLYYMFMTQQNAILADDMGLGKTIQVIGLFAALIQNHGCWPFLVVVPNSTVPNWRREIKNWTPSISVVTYFGSQFSRQTAFDYEMFPQGGNNLRCHVVIASYESMVDDAGKRILSKIPWAGLVVDEGHRLKNDKSQLYDRLLRMKFGFKVLLTGTPLQNNIRELFNLMQFLDPDKDAEDLEAQYGDLTKEDIRELHDMIRPFFLRRTKAEVLPFLPPMVQIIVPVSMSVLQKKLYKSILAKNPTLIKAICKQQTGKLKKAERHNLNNILVQLRKCLCHPFIYNKDIEEQSQDPQIAHRHLVEASGKLQLLNLMLPKLRERGHRVLIFSQFLENLDIVEDFLIGLQLKYCRLDGNLTARQKQQQIDIFNAPDSPHFAFLLSTRSGGVGINLASADTVIIMDPDFNPKQDMQALSRAHRIGQKNAVLVFHMTTRGSVEEKIMEKGKKKLALDHVLIQRLEADEDEEDLESILRHGAAALFDDDTSADVQYDSESINKLLDRSQAEKAAQFSTETAASTEPQFNFARVWQNDRATLEEVTETSESPVDATLWEKILQERALEAMEEAHRNAEGLGRGKRKHATIDYRTLREDEVNEPEDFSSPLKLRKAGDSDGEFQQEGVAEESESEVDAAEDAMDVDAPPEQTKIRPFHRVQSPPPVTDFDGIGNPYSACIACRQRHAIGLCPLKRAGVENCPLCGLAHFGRLRTCPHLNSPTQVRRMLEALSLSNERKELVDEASKYLKNLLNNLLWAERKKAQVSQRTTPVPPTSGTSSVQNTTHQGPAATISRPTSNSPKLQNQTQQAPASASQPAASTPAIQSRTLPESTRAPQFRSVPSKTIDLTSPEPEENPPPNLSFYWHRPSGTLTGRTRFMTPPCKYQH